MAFCVACQHSSTTKLHDFLRLQRLHENRLCSWMTSRSSENSVRMGRVLWHSFWRLLQERRPCVTQEASSRLQEPVNRKRTLPEGKWHTKNPGGAGEWDNQTLENGTHSMAVLIGCSGARAEFDAQASTSGPASVLPLSATLQGGLDGGGGSM